MMFLKLQIVQENEQGKHTTTEAIKRYIIQCRKAVVQWLLKFGNFDWENQNPSHMPNSPENLIMEVKA